MADRKRKKLTGTQAADALEKFVTGNFKNRNAFSKDLQGVQKDFGLSPATEKEVGVRVIKFARALAEDPERMGQYLNAEGVGKAAGLHLADGIMNKINEQPYLKNHGIAVGFDRKKFGVGWTKYVGPGTLQIYGSAGPDESRAGVRFNIPLGGGSSNRSRTRQRAGKKRYPPNSTRSPRSQ